MRTSTSTSTSTSSKILAASLLLVSLCACQTAQRAQTRAASAPVRASRSAAIHDHSVAQAERVSAADGFDGVWRTSYGTLRIRSSAERVLGHYDYDGGADIEGRIVNGELAFVYTEADGTRGAGLFQLSEDGARFDGVWQADPEAHLALDDAALPRWSGERSVPVPGRTWLVVLEQHWEESLSEHEFSYGDMLRAFFQRLPEVEVRHRYFHDQHNLLRYCRELGGLSEPVVVYISSHGSPEGVGAGADNVDGRAIGEALRDVGDIALVHFGACSVMAGHVAEDLRAAAAPHAPFPISGFGVDADWSGSAIVDFTYLDLVLERGFEPADAVEQVRSMLSFASDESSEDDAIGAVDLRILDAPADD